jgi:hypothetical protein
VAARTTHASLAQRQSNGLLIRRFSVRIRGEAPRIDGSRRSRPSRSRYFRPRAVAAGFSTRRGKRPNGRNGRSFGPLRFQNLQWGLAEDLNSRFRLQRHDLDRSNCDAVGQARWPPNSDLTDRSLTSVSGQSRPRPTSLNRRRLSIGLCVRGFIEGRSRSRTCRLVSWTGVRACNFESSHLLDDDVHRMSTEHRHCRDNKPANMPDSCEFNKISRRLRVRVPRELLRQIA